MRIHFDDLIPEARRVHWLAMPLAVFAIGCGEATSARLVQPAVVSTHHQGHTSQGAGDLGPQVLNALSSLRSLTAPFHDIDAAKKAGWGAAITGCMSDASLGGMGFHYGNAALIDGAVDVMQPELLLYEPRKNGELRLVAVEYIVPYTAWSGPTPPKLFGQSFHRNDSFGLWVLHVWHFRHNPRGLFQDWNPDVSCAFAQP